MAVRMVDVDCSNPQCGLKYTAILDADDDTYMAKCPDCKQVNAVKRTPIPITGRCGHCGEPLDQVGHLWDGDRLLRCERRRAQE